MLKKIKNITIISTLFLLISGCGNHIETISPSAEQIVTCKKVMYLKNDLEIEPLGFKLTQKIDDAIWFKFRIKKGSFVINLHIFLDLIARNADEFSV